MERTVFDRVEIGESGEINVTGLIESIAVITTDNHGNESKPFIIKDE